MNLPIDIIPNTIPPKFRWRQVISTPIGKKTVEHEGQLPPSVEGAIVALIGITKQLAIENAELMSGRKPEAQLLTSVKKSREA